MNFLNRLYFLKGNRYHQDLNTRNESRWMVLLTLFLVTCFGYLDRQTLSVLAPVLREEFNMSNTDYSTVLNFYFLAYTIMYAVGGRIMDKLGTYIGMALAVLVWATAGVFHTLVGSVAALAACRFLLAMGEGPVPPGCAKTVTEIFPTKERSFATSVFLMGATIGATLAPVIVIWLYNHWGWRFAFLATAFLGYFWVLLWFSIRKKQKISIQQKNKISKQTLGQLFRHRAMWGVMMLRFFLDPVWFFYIFWLPEYLVNGKGLELGTVGLLAWIPFLSADIGTLAGGSIVSWLQFKGWSINRSHKVVMVISAIMMMSSVFVPVLNATWQYIVAMCIAIVGMQMLGSNNHAIPTQLFPTGTVGTVAGIAGACAGIGSMLLTRFIGLSVDMTQSYIPTFLVVGILYPVMALIALSVLGRIERKKI